MKKTLGMLISERRKQKGMTQLELAQKMGVTDKAVSKWERDLSCPDINSLPVLAEVLGVTIDELMQVKSEKKSTEGKISEILDTVFRGVALAMGVAAAVLSILDALKAKDAMVMLGIGLACIAVSSMRDGSRGISG